MDKKIKRPFEAAINNSVETAAEIIIKESEERPVYDRIDIKLRLTESGRPTWNEMYKLQSFYIHRMLLEIVDRKSAILGKGGKTLIINEALKAYLREDIENVKQ